MLGSELGFRPGSGLGSGSGSGSAPESIFGMDHVGRKGSYTTYDLCSRSTYCVFIVLELVPFIRASKGGLARGSTREERKRIRDTKTFGLVGIGRIPRSINVSFPSANSPMNACPTKSYSL